MHVMQLGFFQTVVVLRITLNLQIIKHMNDLIKGFTVELKDHAGPWAKRYERIVKINNLSELIFISIIVL